MELKETLLRGIYGYGFEKPSAIQQRAIIPCIEGKFLMTKSMVCIAIFLNTGILNFFEGLQQYYIH